MRRQRVRFVLRWGFHVAAAVSLVLCTAGGALCLRSRDRTDVFTTMAGSRFFECALRPGGVSVQWVSDVPPVNTPPKRSLGWSTRAGGVLTPDGAAFLSVPEQTTRTASFAGVTLTSGSAQILRRAWIVYHASRLFPLRGIAIHWTTLLIATALLPATWLVIRLTRGPLDHKSPTFARAIQP